LRPTGSKLIFDFTDFCTPAQFWFIPIFIFNINFRITHIFGGRVFMMPSFDRLVRSLACSILILSSACERPQHSELTAYISRQDDHWTQNPIPVCFEQAMGYEQDRELIRQVVSSEYARAGLFFEGWDTCRPDESGIRITFDENAEMSQTLHFGRNNAGLNQNMVIGFKSRCAGVFSGSVCESNIALHEFGHAIGLHHEMNRRDNVSCTHDQMAGEGEDALQLGPYDTQSVMDYCFLYAANSRKEAIRLSDQDVIALKALSSGLVASLDQMVPMVIQQTWTGFVQGPQIHAYRMALGPKESLTCDNLSSYGPSQPLEQPISIDARTFHQDPKTIMTLCLLGENAAGQRQDPKAFTAIDFRIFDSMNAATPASATPQLIRQPSLYRQDQLVILEIDMGEGLPLRSLYANLSYSQSSIYRSISNKRFESRDLGHGRYQLVFEAEDFPAHGDVYVSTLELTDILGQKLSLFSGAAWARFFGASWHSPALWVDGSYENDQKGPLPLQIASFPQQMDAGTRASWTMEIEENSRLQNIRLMLRSEHGTLEPALTWQWLHDRTWLIEMEIPRLAVNGHYRMDSLILEDIMNNVSYLGLDAEDHTLAGTKVPAPTLTVNAGLDHETNPPQLRGITLSASRFHLHDKAYVELDIVDASSIRQVQLSLRHVTDQGFHKTIFGLDLGEINGKRRIELNHEAQHPLGEYAVQAITLVDRFGNSAYYELDPENPSLLNNGLPVGRMELIGP
jgi:hypothetical protein